MSIDVEQRVAVVTGASRGLGHDIAVALGGLGHPVVLVARSAEALAATEDEIRAAGGRGVLAIPTDVSDSAAIEALRANVLETFGPPLIAINAAGVFGPIEFVKDGDPGKWIATLMVDAVAPYLVARAFVGGMIKAGWGESSTSRRP